MSKEPTADATVASVTGDGNHMEPQSGDDRHLEPIATAAIVVSRPPTEIAPRATGREEKPDERTFHVLDRLARRCVGHIREVRRRGYLLGRDVVRAVKIYSHGDGLTALAGRMEAHGEKVTPQRLGQARTLFLSYSKEEYENRFSTLSDSHLLKAQQLLSDDRAGRDKVLERAQKDKQSVAEMAERVETQKKRHREERIAVQRQKSEPPPSGYHFGDASQLFDRLHDASVGFLRIRAAPPNALSQARRFLASDGVIVLDCPSVAEYPKRVKGVSDANNLRVHCVLIATSPDIQRQDVRGVPLVDTYVLQVVCSQQGQPRPEVTATPMTNPATEQEVEEMLRRFVPEGGLVVDVGHGSHATRVWAAQHQREYIIFEPDRDTFEKHQADKAEATSLDDAPVAEPPGEEPPDLWPMVSEHNRANMQIDGKGWGDLPCCDRTKFALVITGAKRMNCPSCGRKCHAK